MSPWEEEIMLGYSNALLEVMFLISEQLLLIWVARIIMLPRSRALDFSMKEGLETKQNP
jgi:hypothetical protein